MQDYDPVLFAYQYLLGGAHCCSVLTDEKFFFGHLDHLKRVHAAVALPASVLLAWLSYRLIEKPMIALSHRLTSRQFNKWG